MSRISKSIYVTNFPETCSARDIWRVCSDYGTVVDVFIPFKKSKAGKRFTFVRYIKFNDFDRLVENLCTIWIGHFHIHANVARFHRPLKPITPTPRESDLGTSKNSFAPVLKDGSQSPVKELVNSKPALVLDDTCIKEHDFSLSLMGKVKTISAIPNLPIILSNEGFHNIQITYLRGMWVLFALDILESKNKLLNHTGVNSWFSTIKEAYNSFVCDERIIWVSNEGLPIKAWTPNSFQDKHDTSSSADESKDIIGENFVGNKDKIDSSDINRVSESSFSHANALVHDNSNNNVTGDAGSHSEDHFNLYGILNKQHKKASNASTIEPKFPLDLHRLIIMEIKLASLWGNLNFDHVVGSSVGFSCGILCVWEARVFTKEHVLKFDYFVAIIGTWVPTSTKLLVISVYAPQEIT
nr:RNA-directed DNA polymerase, eukaryota, nucleotide-binding alpha-beta plait domain protein [Tanacetum cinerariifolium]